MSPRNHRFEAVPEWREEERYFYCYGFYCSDLTEQYILGQRVCNIRRNHRGVIVIR